MPICVESSDGRSRRILGLLEPRCFSPRNLGGDGERSAARRVSYLKLPASRFVRLSVLKLDGSLFDVNVSRNATVAQLKAAIEELFTSSDDEMVSWSHVWAHFCLSYEGQMLINDKATVRDLGIKDGDQVEFTRHLSVNKSPLQRQSRSQSVPCKRYLPKCKALQGKDQTIQKNNVNNNGSQVSDSRDHLYKDEEEIPMSELKFPQILRGWLSYRRLSEAQAEIRALRMSERLREKAVEDSLKSSQKWRESSS